jgi:hypothetical protein
MSLRRGFLTAAHPEWCRVKLDNRESARPVYVYDTITTRGTAGRLPVWPYFKRVPLTREVT